MQTKSKIIKLKLKSKSMLKLQYGKLTQFANKHLQFTTNTKLWQRLGIQSGIAKKKHKNENCKNSHANETNTEDNAQK